MHKTLKNKRYEHLLSSAIVVLLFYAFLVSIELISHACKTLDTLYLSQIIEATSNPFITLFIGILATAVLQSSSITTSLAVALVASEVISIQQALPFVMGANIGTTVTCAFVALTHITTRSEYRKAVAASTTHGLFNMLTAAVVFPLNYFTRFLERLSSFFASVLFPSSFQDFSEWNITFKLVRPVAYWIVKKFEINRLGEFIIGIFLLIIILRALTFILKNFLFENQLKTIDKYLFGNKLKSLLSGLLITASLQSSSVTTSFLVPMVATQKVSLYNGFAFIIGCNIGTTLTALLAAVSKSDAAVSLAVAHLLFNLIGMLIFFPIKIFYDIPIYLANRIGVLTHKWRITGFLYLLLVYFIIPFLLILLSKI
ncbi:MAG: Na/Pi symporter [Cytophagales bacterium]|nr:Na/Pi symporter [Cytophagales bacterium]MDW8384321.1 Na/Pi symporter [Flammeovirgaceae bacterium]